MSEKDPKKMVDEKNEAKEVLGPQALSEEEVRRADNLDDEVREEDSLPGDEAA